MASIRCLLRSLTPPMHLLIIFPTLAILGGRTFNLTQRPSGWRASLLYFMSAVSKCSKMGGLNYAEQHALLFPNVTEQFWWDFLEKTANLVYIEFQHFSGKMLFSIHTKLPMTNLLKGAASSARAVHFWHDVYWFARRGNLCWTDNTSWVPRHSEDTGHAASFFWREVFIIHKIPLKTVWSTTFEVCWQLYSMWDLLFETKSQFSWT